MLFRAVGVLVAVLAVACSSDSGPAAPPDGAVPGPPGDGGAAVAEAQLPLADSGGLPPLYEAGPAPANSACGAPQTISLSQGGATVSGDTFAAINEFASDVTCGSPLGPYPGPQVYYRVTLPGPATYKLTLAPDKFDAALFAFPASTTCDAAAINQACAGHLRDTPDPKPYAGTNEAMLLQVQQPGDWIIAVDSFNPLEAGTFKLTVETFTKPGNATCAAAATLKPGQAVSGDTIGAPDEYAALHCGAQPTPPSTKVPYFLGPQLYYKVQLTQGVTYRVNLKPSFFARLALFPAAAGCNAAAIEAACASQGGQGDAISVSMGGTGDIIFTPQQGGEHLVVVDSTSPELYGPFALLVAEQSTTTQTAPLTLSFDQGCGGLSGTGDWECGTLSFSPGKNCTLGSKSFGVAPAQGHSGSGVWGTVLNDCYNPLSNSSKVDDKQGTCTNLSVADDSVLRLKVTLPGSWSSAQLSYWSWEDINQPFDWAEIRVDNKVAWQLCEMSYTKPTAWKQRTLDLSAHVGQTVEIGFHFMASAYVNYAGWYLDDLSITGK